MTTATAKRSFVRLPREQRMREIEAAAREVFSQRGYDAASMTDIAKRAGVSEGSIYKFYTNKRDLLLTVIRTWYQSMIDEFMEKLSGVEGTRAQLQTVIWQHLKSIKANPDLCRLFFLEVRSADDYFDSDLFHLNRDYTHVLMDIIQGGIDRGEIRPDISIPLVRDMVFGGIEHRVSGFLVNRGDFDHDETANQLTDMVMAGMAAPAKTPNGLEALVERLERVADRFDGPGGGEG
ncbi:TetR/AcrR family transcriptional regulator [Nitratireductor sp. XY-223]|uniref:TetR/AcrR family transcriptional regulator n=1 Tax=Nitratireductor sp. XY-223 TaxID=2561926 RepID=UPI00145AAAB0|nr:TetR/AcrR family transcriptional regulator [Nitratireductor sp. XY-223]